MHHAVLRKPVAAKVRKVISCCEKWLRLFCLELIESKL